MQKFFTLLLVSVFLSPLVDVSAATKYVSGKKGGCYTVMKSKNTGKTYKKYVDVKYCGKKK